MRFIRSSKNNSNGLDSSFRDGLRDTYATPNPEMWDKISGKLDADIQKRKYNHWYLAAILLLLPIGLTNIFVNYDLEKYYDDFSFENNFSSFDEKTFDAINIQELNFNLPMNAFWENMAGENTFAENPLAFNSKGSGTVNSANDVLLISGLSNATNRKAKGNNNIEKLNSVSKLENNSAVFLASLSAENIDHNANSAFDLDSESEVAKLWNDKKKFKKQSRTSRKQELNSFMSGIYAGVSAGVQNNKLMRRVGQFAPILGDNVKFSTAATFRYGGKLGWNFNRFLSIETGVYKSVLSVNFLDNRYNKIFTEGTISASYIEVPLVLKYRYSAFNGINNLPHSFALSTGVSYAQLTASNLKVGETEIETTKQYFDPYQLGLNLGLDYEWFIHRNISLTAATSATMYSSIQDFPKFSVKTANSDLRLNYQFQVGMNFLLPVSK